MRYYNITKRDNTGGVAMADTIYNIEALPEVDKITALLKNTDDSQRDLMQLVIQSVNLGIAIGKGNMEEKSEGGIS